MQDAWFPGSSSTLILTYIWSTEYIHTAHTKQGTRYIYSVSRTYIPQLIPINADPSILPTEFVRHTLLESTPEYKLLTWGDVGCILNGISPK